MKPFTATAKKIALATAVAITATSLTGLSEASASSNSEIASFSGVATSYDTIFTSEFEAEQFFTIVMSIPDSVLAQGDLATQAWLQAHYGHLPQADFWGCAWALGQLIVSTAIPAAKLLKLKKAIQALGGVQNAVRLLAQHGFNANSLKRLGGAAYELVEIILDIKDVREKCFA